MIRLIVKGDIYQTRAALDARGLLTTTALGTGPRTCETEATVHDDDLAQVQAWFAEPIFTVKGEGFPPGSLLFYTHKEG
jgi:hypothetical protein